MRVACPRSAQPFPSGPFICPVLEEVGCLRAASGSTCGNPILSLYDSFQMGRLYAQSFKSFDALSQIRLDVRGASPRSSASQGYFRHALVMNAQAGSRLKKVSD